MGRKSYYTILFALGISMCCNSQTGTHALTLESAIALPDVSGRIDHLAYDNKNQLVFVAALANNTVEVVDLKSKKAVHSIKGLHGPQGIVFIPESNSIFIANGSNGICDVFDGSSFKKTAALKLTGDADNVRYDPMAHKIYVGHGDGGMAIIDSKTFRLLAVIPFEGHPESFQLDKTQHRIYVNVPGKDRIVVLDLEKKAVSGTFPFTGARSNFPMALDEAAHHLFIGCRHPSRLLIFDTATGKIISSVDIPHDVDDIYCDKDSGQVYLSCGAGYLTIVGRKDDGTYITKEKIATHAGARTSLLIPELHRIIVASPAGAGHKASLLIYTIGAGH